MCGAINVTLKTLSVCPVRGGSCHRIPQPDSVVGTPTCDGASIGTERDAFDLTRMPLKNGEGKVYGEAVW